MGADKHQIEISATRVMRKARAMNSLRRPLLLTRLGMLAERGTRAFWPLWSWAFVAYAALAFNLLDRLTPVQTKSLLAAAALAGLALLIYGARNFRWPRPDEAAMRLDRSMPGRPLTAMWDQQALGAGDAASATLWRAHVARMSEQAARAKPVKPDLKISALDPLGLRFVTAAVFVMAVLFGTSERGRDLGDILGGQPAAALAAGPIYEGWIEPPRYTGLPAIYLNEVTGNEALPVPQGSKVTLRLYGQTGDLRVSETVSGIQRPQSDDPVTQLDFIVTTSGDINLIGRNGDITGWPIDMIPDTAPTIALSGPAERSPQGETKIPFTAQDDYGVVRGAVTLTLDLSAVDRRYGLTVAPEPVDPIALDLPMPFSGGTLDFSETIVEDLSKHVWAGLPVNLSLTASDAIDQTAAAPLEYFALPGRRFFDPLAAALIEQRRDLMWNRVNAKQVARMLRAITHLPEDIFENQKAYLLTRSAIRRLEIYAKAPLDDVQRDEIAEMLWNAATQIEDGDLADAEKRLKRAQDRLSEAIKNGATEDEIAELSEELRRAMQDYIEKLAREAEQNPDQQQSQNGESREITQDQLQAMLDRIQDLMREGRTDEAQQLLEQLTEMMRNMQTARRDPNQQGQGQSQQAMRDLQDTLRQQQGLSDEAFKRLQQEFNAQRDQQQGGQSGQPQTGQQQGEQGQQQGQQQGTPGGEGNQNGQINPNALSDNELAQRQEALRQLLESQRGNLPDPATPEGRAARDALNRAERNMGDARRALEQGDMSQALNEQADALDSLREGIENLGQELARNQSDNMGRQGDQAGRPDPDSQRDPLGRQAGSVGRLGSDETLLNGQDPYLRSRELLDEIRRRSGDRTRPKIELDYLERLLDRF